MVLRFVPSLKFSRSKMWTLFSLTVAFVLSTAVPASAHSTNHNIQPGDTWKGGYHYFNGGGSPCYCEYNVLIGNYFSNVSSNSFFYDTAKYTIYTWEGGVRIGNLQVFNNSTVYYSEHVGKGGFYPDYGVTVEPDQHVSSWVTFGPNNPLQVYTQFLSVDNSGLYGPYDHHHRFYPG